MPGQGSVYRRADGRWVAQVSIGPRTARRYRKRVRLTRADALAALAELTGQLQAGVQPSRMTVSDFLEQWVRDVRDLRPSTRRGYATIIEHRLVPAIGDVRLAGLTPLHVERLLADLSGSLSPRSVSHTHAVLRRALNAARRAGLVSRNVASREFVDAPRVPSEEPRSLTAVECRRFLTAAVGHRFEALFRVALGTGLRQGELLGLAWEDVDLEGGRLRVRRALRRETGATRRDGRYLRDELKTTRSRRDVPLSPNLVEALIRHRGQLIVDGFTPIATGPVFVNLTGGPLHGSIVTHEFYRLLERAGIPRLPFKNLRTTFASRLFEAGIPDRRIADLLGHSRTTTTHGHYIGAGDDWAPAIAAVEAMVG